ncbi:sensor histidine kinase [uncultured Pseudoteredinibacter sp.]|uniref:sensor histidine kinase n=1 Tax=uncultured Pseudoteredinibacter sp. TaxID=1641701 RepID=UPI00262AB3B5|nr:sensor histidine kinase [uncultured Pseudoteredinibacter sp.]
MKLVLLLPLLAPAASIELSLFDQASPNYLKVDTGNVPVYIVAMATSTSGLLWVASGDGVFNYDGYDYKKLDYRNQDGELLGKAYISSIIAAPDGVIWAGAIGNGLVRIDEQSRQFEVFAHKPGDDSSLVNDRIHGLLLDGNEGIWLATDKGLDYFDFESETFQHYDLPDKKGRKFNVIRQGNSGDLLLGSISGMYSFDIESHVFTNISGEGSVNLKKSNVRDIYLDEKNRMWVGTWSSGVYLFDGKAQPQKIGSYALARKFLRVEDEVWLGSRDNGLIIYDFETAALKKKEEGDRYRPMTFPKNTMSTLHEDNNGIIWFGTWGGSIWFVTPSRRFSRSLLYSPSVKRPGVSSEITAIVGLENGELWVSSLGGGIDVFDAQDRFQYTITSQSDTVLQLPSDNIKEMAFDRSGDLFINTSASGTFRYRKKLTSDESIGGLQWQRVQCFTASGLSPNDALDLKALPDGGMLLTDPADAFVVKSTEDFSCDMQSLDVSDRASPFSAVILDDDRVVLMAYGQLYWLKPGSYHVEDFKYTFEGVDTKSEPQFIIGYTLPSGRTFFSTSFSVFSLKEKPNKSFVLKKEFSSDNNSYLWTEHDDNYLWGDGVYWSKESKAYRAITEGDGALRNTGFLLGFVTRNNGDVVTARRSGLQVFRLKNFSEWEHQPLLKINDVFVKGMARQGSLESLVLAAEEREFSISFSALEYSGPQYIRYKYFLEGFSEEWGEVGADFRRATYSNLPPGDYTFKLKSTNRLGVWSDFELTMPITVLPAWYQSYWFYALVLIVFIGFLFAIYRWRISYYRKKKMELEQLVQERTESLQSAHTALALSEKQAALGRLVNGVAHEFNTPLGVISMALSVLQKNTLELFQAFGIDRNEDRPVSSRYRKVSDSQTLLNANVERLSNLVGSFKRISVEGSDYNFGEVNVSEVVHALPKLLKEKIADSPARLSLKVDGDYVVHSCQVLVSEILVELVCNALQHGFSGQNWAQLNSDDSDGSTAVEDPLVVVSMQWVTSTQSKRPQLLIIVEDNGCGIPPDLMGSVFDPFTSKDTSNLGLGLHALVNLVSNVLGGHIACEKSKLGGACFTVLMPTQKQQE